MKTLLLLALSLLMLAAPVQAVYQEGQAVADFSLPDVDGNFIDFGGQAVAAYMLIFFTTW